LSPLSISKIQNSSVDVLVHLWRLVHKAFVNSSLFNEFVCKLAFFWHEWASLKCESNERFKGPRVPKKANLHKNELNTTFFCSTSPLKALNRLKSLKSAWRFVLTSCQIYQNPFTQEKILKFWVSNKNFFFGSPIFCFKCSFI
jgi:hypothetical protein